jgi:DNA-binding NarL/FixJ family response regulator
VPTTVLIVDDHPSFRATARMLLEAEGFHVIGEAPDAAGALREAQALHPDLVLLDVNLPDGSGIDVARELTTPPATGRPAVVLVSSRESCDYGCVVGECGARGFISKGELSGAALQDLL